MTPKKALELVERYATLTKQIRFYTARIGADLEKCPGIKGDRLNVDENGQPTYTPELDEKNRDKGLHLWQWYQPFTDYDSGYPHKEWPEISELDREECPHCYAAHMAVQERKESKRQLAVVKGAMSRAKAGRKATA